MKNVQKIYLQKLTKISIIETCKETFKPFSQNLYRFFQHTWHEGYHSITNTWTESPAYFAYSCRQYLQMVCELVL